MKKNYSYLLLTAVPLLAMVLPFSFENSYEATGMIYPQREITVKSEGGGYRIEYRNFLQQGENFSFLQQPERGDIQSMIGYGWSEGDRVNEGDTLLRFLSSYKNERMSQLLGELEVEKSKLNVMLTGAKPETRERSENEHHWALQQYEIAKANYDRVLPLVEKGFLSQIELAEYEARLKSTEGALEIANKRIREIATGEKPELVDLSLSNISKIELELSTLRNTIERLSIVSPFSGECRLSQYEGYIAGVEDRDTLVYMFPISQDKLSNVNVGDIINITPYGYDTTLKAKIEKIGKQAKMIENIPSIMLTCTIETDLDLPSGSVAKATLDLGDLSFWEYITTNSRK